MARLIRGEPEQARRVPATSARAHDEAARLLARARQEAAVIRRAAETDARDLLADTDRRVAEAVAAERAAARLRLSEEAEARRRGARGELLRLSVAIARRIIGAELRAHPEQLESFLEQALLGAGAAERPVLHVSPDDVEAASRLRTPSMAGGALEIRADPELGAGDCFVVTASGSVDGRLETRLLALGRALGADDA